MRGLNERLIGLPSRVRGLSTLIAEDRDPVQAIDCCDRSRLMQLGAGFSGDLQPGMGVATADIGRYLPGVGERVQSFHELDGFSPIVRTVGHGTSCRLSTDHRQILWFASSSRNNEALRAATSEATRR
jgi:hypothetical protein